MSRKGEEDHLRYHGERRFRPRSDTDVRGGGPAVPAARLSAAHRAGRRAGRGPERAAAPPHRHRP